MHSHLTTLIGFLRDRCTALPISVGCGTMFPPEQYDCVIFSYQRQRKLTANCSIWPIRTKSRSRHISRIAFSLALTRRTERSVGKRILALFTLPYDAAVWTSNGPLSNSCVILKDFLKTCAPSSSSADFFNRALMFFDVLLQWDRFLFQNLTVSSENQSMGKPASRLVT